MKHTQETGAILIILLIYLLIISYLVIAIIEISSLQFKISKHFTDYILAFHSAENNLNEAKLALQKNKFANTHNYTIKLIAATSCEEEYLISADGNAERSKVNIEIKYLHYLPCAGKSPVWLQLWWRESMR